MGQVGEAPMSKTEIFKNDQISVFYYPDDKIIHHQCHKQCAGQPFREAILAATATLEAHKATKWLSDDRLNPSLTPDDQKWAAEVWQPRILKAGWKSWALVLPQQALGQMRMNVMVMQYAKLGVTAKTFSDPAQALAWLKSV
jgi:hypothetical protein